MTLKRIKYLKENWKIIVHLLFSTYRFSVNNMWWSDFDSMFGVPWHKRTPRKIIENYRGMKFRATACYFVSTETQKFLFPKWYKKKFKRYKEN